MATSPVEMNSLMLLVAKILGVKSEGADIDVFALMEGAMNVMGIQNLLPQSARLVDIAEVATELRSGDQILIRTAGSNEIFHHGIFVGPISGVQGGKNLVVDFWGSQDAAKQEAKIRLRTLGEFMAVSGWPELAVMCWDSDTPELREFSAALALGLHRELQDCSGLYHLLDRNCDHFATWCRTLRWESSQVQSIGGKVLAKAAELCMRVIAANTSLAASSFHHLNTTTLKWDNANKQGEEIDKDRIIKDLKVKLELDIDNMVSLNVVNDSIEFKIDNGAKGAIHKNKYMVEVDDRYYGSMIDKFPIHEDPDFEPSYTRRRVYE
eukprot:gene9345-biopygen9256